MAMADRNFPRGVVFDLFHTLVDPEDFRPKEFRRSEVVTEILGLDRVKFLPYWESTMKQRMTTPRPEIEYIRDFAAGFGRKLSEEELREADWALGRYQDAALLNPRAEVTAALKVLKQQGFKMGVLSNTYERDAREWPHSPLAAFFDVASFSHETGLMKPEPGAYSRVLERLGVTPSLSIFVGDGGSQELEGAKESGFGCVIFMKRFVARNGLRSKEELEEADRQADFTVDSFDELCRRASA
jgi:putative hydrolase of the HAD superfamily